MAVFQSIGQASGFKQFLILIFISSCILSGSSLPNKDNENSSTKTVKITKTITKTSSDGGEPKVVSTHIIKETKPKVSPSGGYRTNFIQSVRKWAEAPTPERVKDEEEDDSTRPPMEDRGNVVAINLAESAEHDDIHFIVENDMQLKHGLFSSEEHDGHNTSSSPQGFQDSQFWFTPGLLKVNWTVVIANNVDAIIDQPQIDSLISRSARYSINPMIPIGFLIIEPKKYTNDFKKVRNDGSDDSSSKPPGLKTIAKKIKDLASTFEQFEAIDSSAKITSSANHIPKETLSSSALWEALDKDDKKLARFMDCFKKMEEQKSIKSVEPFKRIKHTDESFTLCLPFPHKKVYRVGSAHSNSGAGNVFSSLDVHQVKKCKWGKTCTDVITAANNGTLKVFSDCNILITHPSGYATSYYHMSNMKSSGLDGREVSVGQRLGYYASNKKDALCEGGDSNGAHLHFTLMKDGRPVSLHNKEIGGYRIQAGNKNYDHNCDEAYLEKKGKKYCPHSEIVNDDPSSRFRTA